MNLTVGFTIHSRLIISESMRLILAKFSGLVAFRAEMIAVKWGLANNIFYLIHTLFFFTLYLHNGMRYAYTVVPLEVE